MSDAAKLRELIASKEAAQAAYDAAAVGAANEPDLLEASSAADNAVHQAVFAALPSLLDAADEVARLRAEVVEECARVCDAYGAEYVRKAEALRRGGYDATRALGVSDGCDNCAARIRALGDGAR